MKSSNIIVSRKLVEILIAISVAIVLTLLLFFIDEGKHNFEGLLSKGNLAGLSIYLIVIFTLALLVLNIIPKRRK